MKLLNNKTISANNKTVNKQWVLIDVKGVSLGRACSKIATLLRGKHKPNYTPHVDCGDNVIVINASKIELSGNKWKDKIYLHYTGYPGGQKSFSAEQIHQKFPERLIEKAVKGMLPKNKLGAKLFKNLKVFVGAEYKHKEQKPVTININELK